MVIIPGQGPHCSFNLRKDCHPYKKRMSGICPEFVMKQYRTTSGQNECPESVPKRDRFRTVSGHSFCPEFTIVLDSPDQFGFQTNTGYFPDISWTQTGQFLYANVFSAFSGHILNKFAGQNLFNLGQNLPINVGQIYI